jgi:hypothetical protein
MLLDKEHIQNFSEEHSWKAEKEMDRVALR